MTTDDAGGDARETAPVVHDLAPDCTIDDVDEDEPYLATVNGVVDYGVFVDLSEHVSGLVHESNLAGEYAVGDELVVELEDVREDGDLSFAQVDVDDYSVDAVDHEYDFAAAADLPDALGETVHLAGEVVQIRQTGGPTVFNVQCVADDANAGVVPCAAFAGAGVRAYPEIELGDPVRVTGRVEERDGAVQVEADEFVVLDGDAAADLKQRLDATVQRQAEPADVDTLVEWDALEKLLPDLRDLARELRRTVLESRPIRIRHHADGDGMCAAVPVELALREFIAEVHEDPDAPRHLLKRSPSKAPFYDMEDATRDLNFALEDRDRHGQKLPMLLMLDNGSTEEDTPAYRNLAHYDIPIAVVDHHHPDPDAVGPLLSAHVNPYLHDEDYRVTTGMLCVELARMLRPDLSDDLQHVPAVAGLSDRSQGEAMPDYLDLAGDAGYDDESLEDVSEALDYLAYRLRYDPGRGLVNDALNVGCDDEARHRELVEFLAGQSREAVDRQLDVALPHVDREELANGAALYRIDVENHAHRFTYPAPGKTTAAVHDAMLEEHGGPAITVGFGPDFAVLRSDGVRLDIPEMVEQLQDELPGSGVSGGGHLVVGSIKYVRGKREAVLDALVEKMADAEIDEELGSSVVGDD
ncbi:RecJ like exonuclease [Halobacteriales archaeon QS_1_68_20]|nr:MAG: RecJ like exonuclease [Halobacteriales archaeon QS_1_68_20]